MRSSSTWSTPILWNISPKMIWTNCRSFCHLTTLHCCRCLIVTSNSNPTTQSIQVHSILQPIGETIVKAISSWAATMQQPQSYTRCLKLHRLKITLEVWQKIFHCLNLKWMEIWWKALFQDTRKQKSSEKMIHWSPKSERTSVQNCHSYLTYIFHIITTLGDSIFQTLQRIMRDAFASRGIIQILQWALLIFIITTSGDLFLFLSESFPLTTLLYDFQIVTSNDGHDCAYKLFFVKSCIIVSRKPPQRNYIFVSIVQRIGWELN